MSDDGRLIAVIQVVEHFGISLVRLRADLVYACVCILGLLIVVCFNKFHRHRLLKFCGIVEIF